MISRLIHGGFIIAAVVLAGCGGDGNPGAIPESKDPQATHAFIENTAGIPQRKSARAGKAGKAAELPPQPPK